LGDLGVKKGKKEKMKSFIECDVDVDVDAFFLGI
jgi:hypothetical protein